MNTEYNPYSPPTSVVAEHADTPSQEVASKGRRFGTLLIDYLGFYLLSFLVGMTIGLMFGKPGAQALKDIPPILLGVILLLLYYGFFEGIWQRTPGKFILGTVVVNAAGEKPSFGQILGRTLCRFIPFEAFSFFGQEGWHDSIPKTKVVLVRKR